MKARLAIATLLAAAAVAAGALNLPKAPDQQRDFGLVGKAPDFSAKSPDGKTYSLDGVTKGGAAYLYFIKKDCPINARAVTFYNQLYKAYGPSTPILGVFNGTADEYNAYQKAHAMPFPVVLDPDQKIISDYKAERSPWVVEVKGDQLVGRIWKGYDQEFLGQISQALADATKAPLAKIDFSSAPTDPRYG